MIIITWTVALTLQVPELVSLDTHPNPHLPSDFSLLTTCKPTWSVSVTVGFLCFHLVAPLISMAGIGWRPVIYLFYQNIMANCK